MSRSSVALNNLRAFVILLVVGFHSVLAYLTSQPSTPAPFDAPPYHWLAIPIIDQARWIGFDLFCAAQYIFLMPFMFLLSGLFVWPSLKRKGTRAFLFERLLRLGVPFALVVFLLMPLAHYPVYRIDAVDPSWSAFWSHWLALPVWASGPLWFLWQLLALDVALAALYEFAPGAGELIANMSASAGKAPGRYFLALVAVSTLAYVPLAMLFQPWDLKQFGPFAFQPGRLLHYVVYFLAGVGIGARGLEGGLFTADGLLARQWARWLSGAVASFVLWLAVTALAIGELGEQGAKIPGLALLAHVIFALASASMCFGFAAAFLQFARRQAPLVGSLSANAYGIYLIHYVFVIWLQYALLGLPMSAIAKAAIVFTVTLGVSWTASVAVSHTSPGARLLQGRTAT